MKPPADEPDFGAGTSDRHQAMLSMRSLIYEVAEELPQVRTIDQSLKWGQPSFEAVNPKTGSPIRIYAVKGSDTAYGLYFICTTTLVQQFRDRYGDELVFQENRAILLDTAKPFPREAIRHCIAMALTYRLK